jgi:hypothetical protein
VYFRGVLANDQCGGFSLDGLVFTTVLGGSADGPRTELVTQATDATLLVAGGLAILAAVVLSVRRSIFTPIVLGTASARRLQRTP